jgi:hypothetical protein
MSEQERDKKEFKEQMDKTVKYFDVIEPIIICEYGVIDGVSRLPYIESKIGFKIDFFTKGLAEKYPKYFVWDDTVKSKADYYKKRIICGIVRKRRRNEVNELAEFLSNAGVTSDKMVSTIYNELKGTISKRTIRKYLDEKYKAVNKRNKDMRKDVPHLTSEEKDVITEDALMYISIEKILNRLENNEQISSDIRNLLVKICSKIKEC